MFTTLWNLFDMYVKLYLLYGFLSFVETTLMRYSNKNALYSYSSREGWVFSSIYQNKKEPNVWIEKSRLLQLRSEITCFLDNTAFGMYIDMFELSRLRIYNIQGDVSNTGVDVVKYIGSETKKPLYWLYTLDNKESNMKILEKLNHANPGVIVVDSSCQEEHVHHFVNQAKTIMWKKNWVMCILTANNNVEYGKARSVANYTLWIPHLPTPSVISKMYDTLLGGDDENDRTQFVKYFEHRKVSAWAIQNWLITIGLRAEHKGIKVSTILATFDDM